MADRTDHARELTLKRLMVYVSDHLKVNDGGDPHKRADYVHHYVVAAYRQLLDRSPANGDNPSFYDLCSEVKPLMVLAGRWK